MSYTMSQTYDALGRVTSETFPDAETVSYNYNEAGWLSSVPGYIDSITYNARGQKTQLQYANGVTTNWTYNAQNFRVTNRSTSGASGSFQNLSYGYDNIGNITSVTDPIYTSDRTFTYDALNRLTSASGTFGANQSQTTCNYSFNAIGNITDKCGVTYSYADGTHPSAVTSTSDGKTYTYDANGNMLTAGTRTQAWDYDNRLSSVTASGSTTSMVYDYTGMRTEKSGSLGTTIFPFSGYEIGPGGISVKYIRIGIENVASKKSTGEKFFYHNDHLGGVNVITNTSGVLAQLIEYDPWGKVSRSEGGGDSLRRFTGKILDPESGLYYYGGRYYDPELGRWISADPTIPYAGDPQSLNRYSYVANNPVNSIDPDGYAHEKVKKKKKKGGFFRRFFGIIVGIAVGWAIGPAGFALVGWEAAGAIGGAVGGAVNTGLNGGNFAANVFGGALLGGLAGGIGPPIFGALGGGAAGAGAWTNFAAAVGAGAITGAVTGGLSTAFYGGKFGQNVGFGALGGAITAAAIYGGYKLWQSLPSSDSSTIVGTQADACIDCSQGLEESVLRSVSDSGDIKMGDLVGSCAFKPCTPSPLDVLPTAPVKPLEPWELSSPCGPGGWACETSGGRLIYKGTGEVVGPNYFQGIPSGGTAMGGAGAWTPPRVPGSAGTNQ